MIFFTTKSVRIFSVLILGISLLCGVLCNPAETSKSAILATVGNRVISVDDFVFRSELTPRPFYCRSNTERDKRIILNSLIAEKLLALEFEKSESARMPVNFEKYIRGRKEQYMRELLYYDVAYDEVTIDSTEFTKLFHLSGLVYELEYYQVDQTLAQQIQTKLLDNPESETDIFDAIDITAEVPVHKVTYEDPEHTAIHEALFREQLKPGSVIGPLEFDDSQFIVMKVKQCDYSPVISETEKLNRRGIVRDKVTLAKANGLWQAYVSSVMKGKEIHFNQKAFTDLAKLYYQTKYASGDLHDSSKPADISKEYLSQNGIELSESFCRIGRDVWTLNVLFEEIKSRPLVFRKKEFLPGEFMDQFKYALVDLIRDHYLTENAYENEIDKRASVKRHVELWQDFYLARSQRESYLDELSKKPHFDQNRLKGSYTYTDQFVDSLQSVYKEDVFIDFSLLNEITLTENDLMSAQPDMPYPMTVPSFPQFNIDESLDYSHDQGQK